MRRLILLSAALLVVTLSMPLVARAPQPGPDAKKLAVWVGVWQYEGDAMASPMGPAAKISGKQTGRMLANGAGLEWIGEEKGTFGGVSWGEVDVYDTAAKTYPYLGYQTDGTTWAGSGVVVGNTWKYTGAIIAKGKSYLYRTEGTLSADGKTFTWKSELTADGKAWTLWTQGKMTKTP